MDKIGRFKKTKAFDAASKLTTKNILVTAFNENKVTMIETNRGKIVPESVHAVAIANIFETRTLYGWYSVARRFIRI